MKRSKASNPPI